MLEARDLFIANHERISDAVISSLRPLHDIVTRRLAEDAQPSEHNNNGPRVSLRHEQTNKVFVLYQTPGLSPWNTIKIQGIREKEDGTPESWLPDVALPNTAEELEPTNETLLHPGLAFGDVYFDQANPVAIDQLTAEISEAVVIDDYDYSNAHHTITMNLLDRRDREFKHKKKNAREHLSRNRGEREQAALTSPHALWKRYQDMEDTIKDAHGDLEANVISDVVTIDGIEYARRTTIILDANQSPKALSRTFVPTDPKRRINKGQRVLSEQLTLYGTVNDPALLAVTDGVAVSVQLTTQRVAKKDGTLEDVFQAKKPKFKHTFVARHGNKNYEYDKKTVRSYFPGETVPPIPTGIQNDLVRALELPRRNNWT